MFDFIPIDFYTAFYYYVMLFIVFLVFLLTQSNAVTNHDINDFQKIIGTVTFLSVLLYIGLRPINGVFLDMMTYNRMFTKYAAGAPITTDRDVLFQVYVKFCAGFLTANQFFLVCASLYVFPMYIVCKKWFANNWFYGFLFLITAFSFWAYGTNGIRNGIAGSIFLLAISRDKKIFQIALIILAINFHQTMMLPAVAFAISYFTKKPKYIIYFWLLCIPISLVSGGFFESFFAGLGFGDDRLSYLTDDVVKGRFASTGFRWDFLLYSGTAVAAGWYYIIKLKYEDKMYFNLIVTYLISNAFWILVIRANFSNRFAYLSWFMIGIIIIFPLLTKHIVPHQHKVIGFLLVAYFAFTFLMNVILN